MHRNVSRWQAAGLHLAISLVTIGGIAVLGLYLWYPHGLYHVAGFDHLLVIMLATDMVAGPLLTLVVYRSGKRGLKLDLWLIALCQVAFLGYGLQALWQTRPVFLVASEVRFNLVFANEIDAAALGEAAEPDWRRLPWAGPRLVGVKPPADTASRQKLLFAWLDTGIDVDRLPRYYVDFADVGPALAANALRTASAAPRVPVMSSHGTALMEVHPRTGAPVRVIASADGS